MRTRADYWSDVFDAYESFCEGCSRLDKLADVARTIADHPDATLLFPSMSHVALGLSTVEQYSDRLQHPMVYLDADPSGDNIEVHFQKGQGKTDHKETLKPPFDESVIQAIFAWLQPQSEADRPTMCGC